MHHHLKSPVKGSAIAWVLGLMGLAVVCFGIYVSFGAGYASRRHVVAAMEDAARLKSDLADFRTKNNRWPDSAEAAKLPGTKPQAVDVRTIAYDAGRKAVVITMMRLPYEGKRFGFFAEERNGKMEWECRRIDLDPKYLPAACRR